MTEMIYSLVTNMAVQKWCYINKPDEAALLDANIKMEYDDLKVLLLERKKPV